MSSRAVHVTITGRVQGVWYRGWTVKEATALGLTGWVRNRRDGSVEAVFSGEESRISTMIARCRKGPPLARVDNLAVEDNVAETFTGFEKRPTE